MANFSDAIASIESAGSGNYSALGPETKGDRAYGRYQIMGSNIGPWSKEILGQEVTPEQFLKDPQLQDAIFQGKFGQYVDKYGPEGAARAWFAGERGMNNPNARDVLGTSVQGYSDKFMKAMGQAQAAPTMQPMAALSPQAAQAAQPLPAFSWSPGQQQQQALPIPPPEIAAPPPLQATPIQYFRPGPPRRAFSLRG